VRRLRRAWAALYRVDLSTMMQYRGETVLWAIWGVVYPAVAMAMWQAAAADPAEGSQVASYGSGGFAAYFFLSMIVGHVTAAWDAYELGYFVRGGTFSAWLLRPLTPIWSAAAANAAWKTFTLLILVPIWIVVGWWIAPKFAGGAMEWLLGMLSLLLAAGISFLWGYIVALAAFWVTRTDAIGELWFGAGLLFGGRLAPVELLPVPLRVIAGILPCQWMLGFPCEVLMGRRTLNETVVGLVCQLFWLVAGVVAFRLLWRVSLKRYSAVGG
jgi:ABC-2 type transport system permease protein